MKKNGFTLAEVLITLVIIGVIAAMTIPTMINKTQEQENVVALKKAYSIMAQAFKLTEVKYGPIDTWEWSSDNIIPIFEKVSENLQIMYKGDNTTNTNCFPDSFKYLGASTSNTMLYSKASARLSDGMSLRLEARGTNCNQTRGSITNICGIAIVDTNGNAAPNLYGKDLFQFYVTKNGLLPLGTEGDLYNVNTYCNINSHDMQYNGVGCAAWVIAKGNMDYLRKPVSW